MQRGQGHCWPCAHSGQTPDFQRLCQTLSQCTSKLQVLAYGLGSLVWINAFGSLLFIAPEHFSFIWMGGSTNAASFPAYISSSPMADCLADTSSMLITTGSLQQAEQ